MILKVVVLTVLVVLSLWKFHENYHLIEVSATGIDCASLNLAIVFKICNKFSMNFQFRDSSYQKINHLPIGAPFISATGKYVLSRNKFVILRLLVKTTYMLFFVQTFFSFLVNFGMYGSLYQHLNELIRSLKLWNIFDFTGTYWSTFIRATGKYLCREINLWF